MIAVLLLTVVACAFGASASTSDCADLSLAIEFWSGESVRNTIDGKLKLAFDATSAETEHAYATLFAEPQDLTAHSLVSFNLYKVREPLSLYLSVVTPYGEHFTESVALFEQKNTITVDLSTSEFSVDGVDYDQPVVGLSAVSEIRLYLVSSDESSAGEAVIDSMVVCATTADGAAPVAAADDNVRVVDLVNTNNANAAPVAFPDVESLSAALISALSEVQQLTTEVAELRASQRRALRAFEQFSENARSSLDTAIDALSGSMSANADQTLANAKLLERFRTSLSDSLAAHSSRLEQLEAQFAALQSLGGVHLGESLSDAVARNNAESVEAAEEQDANELKKRSIPLAASVAAETKKRATHEVRDMFYIDRPASAKRAPFVPSP